MGANKTCSANRASDLVRLFIVRSGPPVGATASHLIERWMAKLRRKGPSPTEPVGQLDPFLLTRGVVECRPLGNLNCDGYLEALGNCFKNGFRMGVKEDMNERRMRFTIAHELCHTYFYELVPELKFCDHGPDDEEEALCNQGAAAFLIPHGGLRRRAANSPVSLETLELLADEYGVSIVTMFLRLRALGHWNCELSIWTRRHDGDFKMDRLYGGRSLDWEWFESAVPLQAWESNRVVSGNTFIQFTEPVGSYRFRPIAYQAAHRGDTLIVLWGNFDPRITERLPLFNRKLT
jgi:IrrE N-terminal-like domain